MHGHRPAVVDGIASSVPARQVTNDEIADRLGIDSEWIRTRTGVSTRRHVAEGARMMDLAVEAGARALAHAGDAGADAVVLATSTPDRPIPAAAPEVAHRLGLGTAAAYDLVAACSGFVYGLAAAAGLIATGTAERVLLVAAEVYSPLTDPFDRGTAAILADGAGAIVLRAGDPGPGEIGGFVLGSDGSGSDLIQISRAGSYLHMDGRATFRQAVLRMAAAVRQASAEAGWQLSEVDAVVAHQANARILRAVGQELGLSAERMLANIDRVGNTGAASIPLLLHEAARRRRLEPGNRVVLAAFGAGLTWGACTLTWPKLPPFPDGSEADNEEGRP